MRCDKVAKICTQPKNKTRSQPRPLPIVYYFLIVIFHVKIKNAHYPKSQCSLLCRSSISSQKLIYEILNIIFATTTYLFYTRALPIVRFWFDRHTIPQFFIIVK